MSSERAEPAFCPDCGEECAGHATCPTCGLVFEERVALMDDFPGSRFVNAYDQQGMYHGNNFGKRYYRAETAVEAKLRAAHHSIELLVAKLQRRVTADEVVFMLRRTIDAGLYRGGRDGEVMLAAVGFVLCRTQHKAISIGDAAAVFNVTCSSVLATVRAVTKALGIDIEMQTDPAYYVGRVLDAVPVPPLLRPDVERRTRAVAALLAETDAQCGRRPLPTVGGIVLLLCRAHGVPASAERVAGVCRASAQTVRQRVVDVAALLVEVAHRLPGSAVIGVANVATYIDYIVDVCVPLSRYVAPALALTHPAERARRAVTARRKQQIAAAKRRVAQQDSAGAANREEHAVELLLIAGVAEEAIIDCATTRDLVRTLSKARTHRIPAHLSEDTLDDEIQTEEDVEEEEEV